MLIVADINTLWRRKPWEALARLCPTLGLEPMDLLTLWRMKRWPSTWAAGASDTESLSQVTVPMPFGWASRTANPSQYYLWKVAQRSCSRLGRAPSALVITNPHYLSLVRRLSPSLPCFYYCSDDYRSYQGWNPDEMREMEIRLVQTARHSFFVSRALAERAAQESGIEAERITVSMNAADASFLQPASPEATNLLRSQFPSLRAPVVGVIGVLNERIDLEILWQCLLQPELGCLLLVGPCGFSTNSPLWEQIKGHAKCLWVGSRPHQEIPAWLHLVDIVLIPYRKTTFNFYCSPMRLFDSLASGTPIVGTFACDQLNEFRDRITLLESAGDWRPVFAEILGKADKDERRKAQIDFAREHTWQVRAQGLLAGLGFATPTPDAGIFEMPRV